MTASLELVLLLIIVGVGTLGVSGLLITAYARYRVKKTLITRNIIITHIYFLLGMIASLLTAIFLLFDIPVLFSENDVLSLPASNRTLILTNTFIYQCLTLFLLPTWYYFFRFARLAYFLGEEKVGKFVKGVNILILVTILIQVLINSLVLYEILCSLAGLPLNVDLLVLSILVLPFSVAIITFAIFGLVAFPAFFASLRLWKRVSHDDPNKSNLLYLAVIAFVSILLVSFNVLDLLLLIGGAKNPTIANLFLWLCIPVIVYAGFRGYFGTKSGNERSKPSPTSDLYG